MKGRHVFLCALFAAVSSLACTASQDSAGGDGDGDVFVGDGDIFLGDGDVDGGTGGFTPTLPEETEEPGTFRPPVVTGDYLWSTNPESGKVALIHATTLATRVLSAGLGPTYLAAIPRDDADAAALVINVGSQDASYFRVEGSDVQTRRIQLKSQANRWAISPSGRYAVAFSLSESELDPTDGLQELGIIDLDEDFPEVRRETVGFRPSFITFDDSEEKIIVVTELGVSLVPLPAGENSWISFDGSTERDVSVTRDGSHALVRFSGKSRIEILTLDDSAESQEIELSGIVTDLDLAPTGRAVAVVRDSSEMVTFLVENIIDDPEDYDVLGVPDQVIGSAELTSDGLTTVLYTNAADSGLLSVVNLEPGDEYLSRTVFDTQTSIDSVHVSPSGHYAVARAKGIEGSNAGAFTVLSLTEKRFPRVFGTGAHIQHIELMNEYGVVTASSAMVHEAHLISLAALQADAVPLASTPISAGILPRLGIGFAAQSHPEGRVTFFDFSAVTARTLTGFELASEAVQE